MHFRFAKKNDLPMLEYCTLPRTGALEVILDVLGPRATKVHGSSHNGGYSITHHTSAITKICDVTIAYPEGKPLDLFQIIAAFRPPCTTHVHYRIFDVKDVSGNFLHPDLKLWLTLDWKKAVNSKFVVNFESPAFLCVDEIAQRCQIRTLRDKFNRTSAFLFKN